MAVSRFQRSIRFSASEWNAICEAAEGRQMKPAEFVRAASAGVAAREIDLDDGRLTPELIELIRRTFRGMHLLAHLKREELAAKGKEDDFKRAPRPANSRKRRRSVTKIRTAKADSASGSRRSRPSSALHERLRTVAGASAWRVFPPAWPAGHARDCQPDRARR